MSQVLDDTRTRSWLAAPQNRPEAARPGRLPGSGGRVSVCIIARDEEGNLPECLESVRALFEEGLIGEIIVNDTGSTDGTAAIAREFGCKVIENLWQDSFALARNQCLDQASCPYVFWLDADDRMDGENVGKLRALILGLADENAAYRMQCLCLGDPVGRSATVVDHVRLFRNRRDVRWEFRVHEQILPAVRRTGGEVRWSDVVIRHTGYQDPALRGRKLARDLRLLKLEEAERPEHPFVLFNLGQVHQELGQTEEAVGYLRRSVEGSQPGDSIVRKLYALLVQCHRRLGEPVEALACCREGRRYYPDDAELLFQEALARTDVQDVRGAVACLERLLGGRDGEHFGSVAEGLRGYRARHNLAVLYRRQGRLEEAEAQWRAALGEREDFEPAWVGLGEVCLVQRRWDEVEDIATRLGGGSVDGAVLRARGLLARKQFAAAREFLEAALRDRPEEAALWQVLSHVLLQEGKDEEGAERVLRKVIELDPANTQAMRNLEVLLRGSPRRHEGHEEDTKAAG